jgi:hypothetical protein
MRSIRRLSAAILFSAVLFAPFADEKSIDSCVNRAPTNEFGYISPGINFTDLKDINNSLATLGLSSFPVYTHPVDSTVIGIADIKSRR